MYENDSFFTLSQAGQIGLFVLSAVLFLGVVYLAWRLSAGKRIIVRLAIGLALFFGFVWLSPQVYYQYYRLIIDGLPAQIVIGGPHGLVHLAKLLSFQSDANLSAHSQGILGWALIAASAFRR